MGAGIDGRDLAKVVTGTISAPGTADLGVWRNQFNLTLWGGTGVAAQVQRSFDAGVTYHNLTALGQPVVLSSGSEPLLETELGVLYRLNVTAVTGTLNFRASQ